MTNMEKARKLSEILTEGDIVVLREALAEAMDVCYEDSTSDISDMEELYETIDMAHTFVTENDEKYATNNNFDKSKKIHAFINEINQLDNNIIAVDMDGMALVDDNISELYAEYNICGKYGIYMEIPDNHSNDDLIGFELKEGACIIIEINDDSNIKAIIYDEESEVELGVFGVLIKRNQLINQQG